MYRTVVSCLFVLITAMAILSAPAPSMSQETDQWANFQFLMGNWTGVGSGQPGEAVSGGTSFAYDLEKKVIVRKNRAEYTPQPDEKAGLVHEDLMIMYWQVADSTFRAVYFDNEDHVIHYRVSSTGKNTAVFESETNSAGPHFRMVYGLSADGLLTNEFFIAPPGGEFKSYVKGMLKKSP